MRMGMRIDFTFSVTPNKLTIQMAMNMRILGLVDIEQGKWHLNAYIGFYNSSLNTNVNEK